MIQLTFFNFPPKVESIKNKKVKVSILLEEGLLLRLKEKARDDQKTRSQVIRELLESFL